MENIPEGKQNAAENQESPPAFSRWVFTVCKAAVGSKQGPSTLSCLCGCAWVCLWEGKQRCRSPSFFSGPHPSLLPSHTLDPVQNIPCGGESLGRGGRELCVKCLLEMHCGVFSCMGNHLRQAFPQFPYLSCPVSCLCFQLCVLLLASCTKLIFSQSLKTELTWLGCSCVLLNSSLNLFVM